MIIFVATDSTADGRITGGKQYTGQLIYVSTIEPGLRVVVFDNKKEWMTFKPSLFRPPRAGERIEFAT